MQSPFNQSLLRCRKCRRLVNQLNRLQVLHPDYWNRPVLASGFADAPILIVGLAPGLHGANRTGVPFVGDASGNLLHEALVELELTGKVMITNAVKCLPIDNLPSSREVRNCRKFLVRELDQHVQNKNEVVFALGGLAHRAIISALGSRQADYPFSHGAVNRLADIVMVSSYHCSRYNTQTGRLTPTMFKWAMAKAKALAGMSLSGIPCDD